MKKKMSVAVTIIIAFLLSLISVIIVIVSESRSKKLDKIDFDVKFTNKVTQWQQTLGYVGRNSPTETSSEGLNDRYPTYGTSLADITDEEKDNVLQENALILASSDTYDAIDSEGNLLLNGSKTGKKLYKHISSVGMYYGDVSDQEKAVIEKITITANEQRNYVTGLYAPAGEIVKIEISQQDLEAIGGELLVCVGQVSHRNNLNNIWKARNDFSRMPVIANKLSVKTTTAYVGNPLGGPIYIYPSTFGKTFSVTISGAVKYAHYVHGKTTAQECEEMKSYTAPYYDFELWDLGVRLSGSSKYASYDYENLVQVGDLWEKIVRTSRQVPCSANVTIGVGYVYDCFVAAGSACAFQGGHSWINAPSSWMADAMNYKSMVTNGFWGNIHEYNHLYQSYGMESSKTNEVTNNATSLLSYALYTNISANRSTNDSSLGGGWNRYTDPSRSLRETVANAQSGQTQSALNVYADIIHSFGVDVFTKATRLQNGFGVDNWYEALSKATNYNFTYYFEKLLGQTISDDKKSLYDTADRILFVPIATVFQTGRDYFDGENQVFIETVRPYQIERGDSIEINFDERLILPADFSFAIKSVSQPQHGLIEHLSGNTYKFTPDQADDSGNIKVEVQLISQDYTTRNVTLTLAFKQYDKNQVKIEKYTSDGTHNYSSVEDALTNNFAGYTKVADYKSSSTFVNGLANRQIGVVEGKIYIPETGNYAFCLRSGRGNNTLYLSVNDKSGLEQVISLNSDHGGFALEGEHVVNKYLNKGDYLYFKEITLSRHASDAFSELGMAYLDSQNPVMKTVPTAYLCTNDMLMPTQQFTSSAKYTMSYNFSSVITKTSTATHSLVSVNMSSWDNSTSIENVFDGDSSTFYHNNRNNFVSEDNPFVLVADMGKTEKYNSIKIISRTSGQYNLPSSFKLYTSLDNENWQQVGDFKDLSLQNNTVVALFDDVEFRYYKIYVTDTKSASGGNKYVTIASIEFALTFVGEEKSPYLMDYYKSNKTNFTEVETVSTFGKIIKGNGTIKYSFKGTGFVLMTRQDNDCKITLSIDGKNYNLTLSKSATKTYSFVQKDLPNSSHDITIKVLSGNICLDSFAIQTA